MTSKNRTDMRCLVWYQATKKTLGKNGRAVDPQDDVGWRRSQGVMWPSHQSLHAYTLCWAIGVSSNHVYLINTQLTYVGWLDVGLALFQDSHYSRRPFPFPSASPIFFHPKYPILAMWLSHCMRFLVIPSIIPHPNIFIIQNASLNILTHSQYLT